MPVSEGRDPIRRALMAGGVTKIVTIVFGIVNLGISARSMSASEFGLVGVLVASATLFTLLDLGASSAVVNELSKAREEGDKRGIYTIVGTLATFVVVVAGITAVTVTSMVLSFSPVVASQLEVDEDTLRTCAWAYGALVSIQIGSSAANKVLVALQRGDLSATSLLIGAVTGGIGCLVGGEASLPPVWFLGCLLAPTAFVSVAVAWIVVKTQLVGLDRESIPSWDYRFMKLVLRNGWPYLILTLVAAASYQTDTLVVGATLGSSAAATFVLASRMFNAVTSLYSIGIQQVWATLGPIFATGDAKRAVATGLRWGGFMTATSAILSLIVLLGGRTIVRYWAGPDFVPSWSLLSALCVWSVYVVNMTLAGAILNAAGHVRSQALANVVMAIAVVPLSVALARAVGPPGPVLASLGCHVVIVAPVVLVRLRRIYIVAGGR